MDTLAIIGALLLAAAGTIFALWMGASSARFDEERERDAGNGAPGSAA